ncbi:MAG: RNA polymerase-associated protein RapA [Candidatus Didemnitutus sp.]|nr:RNA polymerase-associated protein RapA [Candidatus Didemnitutus sp.]
MSLSVAGQRCLSEREPELGLGVVAQVDRAAKRIAVDFPAAGERRLYALNTPVLKRVLFRVGEVVAARAGARFTIERVTEQDGLLTYAGEGRSVREDEVSDVTSVSRPPERLLAGQAEPGEVFDLRLRALRWQAAWRQSEVRGFLGARVDLIPHQFYILQEVASRRLPRVLLADEVGLGKTIEAGLILQRLLAVGQVRRALVLVPESLTHQWFVELLRRFNLWFSIYDEARCAECERSEPEQNPFLAAQLALASTDFLAASETRREQAVAAGWDLLIVDEAHHLEWQPDAASAGYQLVEQLAARTPGLLLLTATPTQLGLAGHFARLRLLDPARYADFAQFTAEADKFTAVAAIADKIVGERALTAKDHTALRQLFTRDPARVEEHLAALKAGRAGAREALLRTLLDQHGTGRVVFRNTRAGMTGFPRRQFCPVPCDAMDDTTLLARIARELEAEETGGEAAIRYSFRDDPRIAWLAEFLAEMKPAKVLLICRSARKVAAIEAALQEKAAFKVGQFHEGLPLVQRDRQAAWFAEPDGAQLLLCSEIGSEGRNFQFAHHLVLFDLPLNPGLVEQRIGRLDRIGQTETIRVHVPYVRGSAQEPVVEWYHAGLDAFEAPLHGGADYQEAFRVPLLTLATGFSTRASAREKELAALVADTQAFRRERAARIEKGRDRLLELNSFNAAAAARVLDAIRAAEADRSVRTLLLDLLDHFGVTVKEHEGVEVTLDASHAYVESFPSIPADGLLATFDRRRALSREDIAFLSADHALLRDTSDLLVDSPAGTTAFGTSVGDAPNLFVEAVYVLEPVAEARWGVDRFLAPQPVRVVVDVRGNDLTDERAAEDIADTFEDGDLHRFLEQPGFNAAVLKKLVSAAGEEAETRAVELRRAAADRAEAMLTAERQRLLDLQKLNDHVRPEEIALVGAQLEQVRTAIAAARLRLDSLRLVLERPRD